jgi:hypothetical protein
MSLPLASPAQRPPGIRTYATLVVALAAFLASMVALRVPFRGYLIEARLSGRLGDGLDKAGIESWFKTAAPGVSVRVDAAKSGHCDTILQQVAPRAGEVQIAMNRVARQFAEHYVAERREAVRQASLARLQAELQTARDTEDAVRSRLDELRQSQTAHAPSHLPAESLPPPVAKLPSSIPTEPLDAIPAPLADDDARTRSIHERLASLRAELASLLAHCTEAHPKVITLRLQIAGLEHELAAPGSDVARGNPTEKHALRLIPGRPIGLASNFYESMVLESGSLPDALANLAAATRARQWAERQLQTEVESLATAPGYPWSVESARVLARVGGTPRALTLAVAALVTLVAAALMFVASAALLPRLVIQTTDDLTQALSLPLVATMQVAGRPRQRRSQLAPWLVQTTVHAAEIMLAAMFLALAFTMLSDRWLAGQIMADPFGVLSEVAGRLLA